MKNLDSIIEKYVVLSKDVEEALAEEYVDHQNLYWTIKNERYLATQLINEFQNAKENEIATISMPNTMFKEEMKKLAVNCKDAKDKIKNIYDNLYAKIVDSFFEEISSGTDKNVAKKIKNFILKKQIIHKCGFGEAELWFYELKELITQ